jgi:Flp pilus assembly protein TadG
MYSVRSGNRRSLRFANRRGAVLIEFVLVTLILLSLVISVVEVGRAAWDWENVGHATREAARWAIVRGSDSQNTRTTTATDVEAFLLSRTSIRPLVVATTWAGGSKAPGSTVTVTATYTFRPVIPFLPTFAIRGSSSMPITF